MEKLLDRNSHSLQASSPILSYPRVPLARLLFTISPKWRACSQATMRIIQRLFPLLPKGLLAHVSAFDWLEILSVELRLRRKSKNEKGRKLQTTKFRQLRFLGGKL